MSYNTVRNETMWNLDAGQLVDVSAPSISYVAVPFQGVLIDARSSISASISVATATVTIKRKSGSNTAITLGTISITVGGGRNARAVLTGSEADCTFTMGDTLIFDSDGGSSTTSICNFTATFKGI